MSEALVDVGGARLWVARTGSGPGPPLLLASGGPGCCDTLGPVAALVDDLGPVIRFEQRGCGRSDPGGPWDVATCVADLEAVRAASGAEGWIAGGHSWGANLALAWALEHPARARGLVYLAGNGVQNDRDWSEAYHRAKAERGEREPDYLFPPNLEVNRALNASWREYVRQPGLWRRIAALRVPALIVVAERDIRPAWPAEQLAEALPGARLARVADAGHALWLDRADALRTLLREFVGSLA